MYKEFLEQNKCIKLEVLAMLHYPHRPDSLASDITYAGLINNVEIQYKLYKVGKAVQIDIIKESGHYDMVIKPNKVIAFGKNIFKISCFDDYELRFYNDCKLIANVGSPTSRRYDVPHYLDMDSEEFCFTMNLHSNFQNTPITQQELIECFEDFKYALELLNV